MDKLQKAREKINDIDAKMAKLFEERMQTVESVIAYKQAHQMKVLDQSREQEVIGKNLENIQKVEYKDFYREFITKVMELSRKYQKAILYHETAGYAGTKGAFSHIAACSLFPDAPLHSYPTFHDVFQAVEEQEISYGVIPFENSYTGEVGEVLDLLYHHNVCISKIYDLKITQNLLGISGADVSEIKQVYSKDQAISQCRQYLRNRDYDVIPYPNTALAAEYVAKQKDPSKAAIASRETAQIFHLDILEENINTSEDNTTRFIVIQKALPAAGNHFSLLFTLRHAAGELAKVMQLIADNKFNMENIKSRALSDRPWEYYFYVEIEGSLEDEKTTVLIKQMKQICDQVKVLGCYNKESRDEL